MERQAGQGEDKQPHDGGGQALAPPVNRQKRATQAKERSTPQRRGSSGLASPSPTPTKFITGSKVDFQGWP